MPDNVLKAVVDAVAESDNESGGQLITRLKGAHLWGSNDGELFTADPDRLTVLVDTFSAAWVGLGIDVIGAGANAGRYRVATYVDARNVDLETLAAGAPGFVDEESVQWRLSTLLVESTLEFLDPSSHVTDTIGQLWVGLEEDVVTYGEVTIASGANRFDQLGTPATGAGYLTRPIRSGVPGRAATGAWNSETEVVEASQSYSSLDKLRRAMLVDYATEEELDRVGRNLAVVRPRGIDDDTYRALIKVLSYLPRGTIYALELVAEAFFPGGGYTNRDIPYPIPTGSWVIYEDLKNHNNTVYLLLPALAPGTESEGRAFLVGEEEAPSTAVTTVDVDDTPISVREVLRAPATYELEMDVLPSADTPAWTYQGEGAAPPAEGSVFSVGSLDQLVHVVSGAPSSNSGRYYQTDTTLDAGGGRWMDWETSAWWRKSAATVVNGYPWHLRARDGEIAALLEWDEDDIRLNGTTIGTGVLTGSTIWNHFRVWRRGNTVYASLNGKILAGVAASAFGASASTDFSFGYINQASANQNWTVWWDQVVARARGSRNWWNLYSETGDLSAGDPRPRPGCCWTGSSASPRRSTRRAACPQSLSWCWMSRGLTARSWARTSR
jgi:hypothetical protein